MDTSSKPQSEMSSTIYNSFIDKLKPSSKNKYLSQKITKNKTSSESSKQNNSIMGGEEWGIPPIPKSTDNLIQISQNGCENSTKDLDFSNLYENMNYVNSIIEENYQQTLTEHSFLNTDSHLVLPFLLLTSKEIHRMTLSDYEMKLEYRKYKIKCKKHKLNSNDYYKRGIIYFYQSKYIQAYLHFKQSYSVKKDTNVLKWLCFSMFILIFCVKNEFCAKIDYYNMHKVKFSEDNSNTQTKENEFIFFNCCTIRKRQIGLNNDNTSNTSKNTIKKDSINRNELCKELLNLLPLLMKNNNFLENTNTPNINIKNENEITALWIYMLLGIYVFIFNKDNTNITKIFDIKKLFDPKACVKKIKDIDDYLGYVAYAQMNTIIALSVTNDPGNSNSTNNTSNSNTHMNIKNLLLQVIKKDMKRIEGYLLLWEILTKSTFLDYKQAYAISKKFYDNFSSFNFDNKNNVDYLYIILTHGKSLYYLKNYTLLISFYIKELCCNFLYPSIYYLIGKYAAKSKSKHLKNISISILNESSKLLFEDLQTSSLYWIGYVNYCSGNYEISYEKWKKLMNNTKKCFDFNKKKYDKINGYFFRKFSNFGNTYLQLKNDIKVYYKDKKCNSKDENNSVTNNIDDEIIEKCYTNLNIISTTFPQLKDNTNVSLMNTFYKSKISFYIQNKYFNSISSLMKIITSTKEINTMTSPFYIKSLFLIQKILNKIEEYSLSFKFAFFTILKIKEASNCSLYKEIFTAYMNIAKAMFKLKKNKEAFDILKCLLSLSAIYPIDDMKYLSLIYKENNISITNDVINSDFIQKHYDIDNIYQKCIEIIKKNYTKKEYQYEVKIENNIYDSTDKLEVFIDSQIELLNASISNKKIQNFEFISIISNVHPLFLIGKYAAKTQTKIEIGINSLSDFLQIIKFENNYNIKENKLKLKYKAKFYLGVLFIINKEYDKAKRCFDRIKVNYFNDQERKNEYIIAFNIFYNKNNPNLNFDYNQYANLI